MIRCADLPELLVSDDPADHRRAERHAESCAACATRLAAQRRLEQRVSAWRDATPAPDPALAARLLARRGAAASGAQGESAAAGRLIAWRRPAVRGARLAVAAAAAMLAIAVGVTGARLTAPTAPDDAVRLLAAEALDEAREAQRRHARAVARLEQAAAPILALADDPSTSASEAARLDRLGDRLAHLDATISEIQAFLDSNPAHPGGRTLLLAVYTEKTDVLRTIVAPKERS